MNDLEIRDLNPMFASEVHGFDARVQLGDPTRSTLQDAFNRRGILVFRDIDISKAEQVRLSRMLIGREDLTDGEAGHEFDDNFYISNTRPNSAAPFGRLQFHADTMWAAQPFEVLSLYGVEVAKPVVPTTFISGTYAWATMPENLRSRVEGLQALHTAGEVRRGDMTDVLLSPIANPPSTIKPVALTHPRTGVTVLYVCEQMTKEIVGLPGHESEALLAELFAHLYQPWVRWNHEWRPGDLVVWDNIAMQHARPNVAGNGPARTLRKVASPIPKLDPDQLPTYSAAK
jgi:alpha-ketoglutarate-dependent taurine dioxygenase